MKVLIYHANIQDAEPGVNADCRLNNVGHSLVAVMNMRDLQWDSDDALMDCVWQYSNTIETPWYESDAVEIVNGAEGLRSSMVGDWFEILDGAMYEVLSAGFKKLERTENPDAYVPNKIWETPEGDLALAVDYIGAYGWDIALVRFNPEDGVLVIDDETGNLWQPREDISLTVWSKLMADKIEAFAQLEVTEPMSQETIQLIAAEDALGLEEGEGDPT